MAEESIHRQNIVACVWDFDKTLIDGYMQKPLFERFGVDENRFWKEVNALPALYEKRGIRVSPETVYLNHILTYVREKRFAGLNNEMLRAMGAGLAFYPGLPAFLQELKDLAQSRIAWRKHDIRLEHYIVSTGIAEMIRGSAIAPFVDGIFASEFIENPAPAGYHEQGEIDLGSASSEISQIGFMVDNTIKTRFIFEINKGCNVNPDIDVNAKVPREDRRVPIANMIYIADGPSDIPVFSVVKKNGGKALAVFDRESEAEFEQNDHLLQSGRIHAYGPADYRADSTTARWLRLHVSKICERICTDIERSLATRLGRPPRHIREDNGADPETDPASAQEELFRTEG